MVNKRGKQKGQKVIKLTDEAGKSLSFYLADLLLRLISQ